MFINSSKTEAGCSFNYEENISSDVYSAISTEVKIVY